MLTAQFQLAAICAGTFFLNRSGGSEAVAFLLSASALVVLVIGAASLVKRDISSRRQTAPHLVSDSEHFHLLIESAKDYAIFMLDPQGYVMTWNSGAERIKGYARQEIIGQHFSRFHTAEDVSRGKPEEALRIANEFGVFEEDAWRVRKDGSKFRANVVIRPLKDELGHLRGFAEITRDLTERLQAEEQAQRFFQVSVDLMCIANTKGYFLHLNPAWEEVTGFTDLELRSKPYLDFVHPDDRQRTIEAAGQLAGGQTVALFENRYRCKNGSYRWLLWNTAVSGDRQLFFCIARDVTGQKLAADAIEELNKKLNQRNLELEVSNMELEAFSYSVSHDLRAPLRSLDGFSQVLLDDYKAGLDEEGQDFLKRIRAASQQMGILIDDLLKLSRISRTEMKREKVDLSAIAREIAAPLTAADPQRKARFVIEERMMVIGDANLLKIAMTNLIENAWKFSSKKTESVIEIASCVIDHSPTFFVRDNGAGFNMEHAAKLFGAFQRMHSNHEFAGTGIGLATVQRVVRQHGGRVWAESQVDCGATFYFTV
jgi:PAS domain S-box-containing protein